MLTKSLGFSEYIELCSRRYISLYVILIKGKSADIHNDHTQSMLNLDLNKRNIMEKGNSCECVNNQESCQARISLSSFKSPIIIYSPASLQFMLHVSSKLYV